MGIGVSIFLIALGAVLAFAVETEVSGLDIQAVGWIVMIVGALGLIITLIFWGRRRAARVVERDVAPPVTDRVVERDVAPPTRGRIVERGYDDPYR